MNQPQPFGLASVATERLERMFRHLHRQELACPLTPVGLVCIGLQDNLEAVMSVLRGLDRSGVRAVLVAVLAERRAEAARTNAAATHEH